MASLADSNRHQRIKQLFVEASALEPAKQRELLDRACAGDLGLRAEVESLLDCDSAAFSPLDALPAAVEALRSHLAVPPEPIPESIGGYRIIRKLGEGGMGVVYEAEQANPRRTVALKVIQRGVVSGSLLRRFEREAEVLGQLQHPGIAQIYEAGASDTVQPFFAMELVQGQALLDYASSKGLGTRERLDLLARVCDAVDHAHQRGVIHRDLKPGNILVDMAGQPKVLDFGIARLTGADLQTATLQTSTGQIVGTVPYISPEQASGDPGLLDRRTDVYSLGVILYELLTQELPHHLEGKPLPEALRIIREEEPSRIGSFCRVFRGDIETITGKALEKEKGRRYASAAELAADIRRHLADQPITARPTSALYQMRKFARRNKALVGGVAIAFSALLAGTAVSVWQARLAIEQRRLADQNADQALLQAHRASLEAAAAALEANDPVTVEEQLEAIEPGLRDWSWRYFRNRIDRSVAVLRPGEPIAGAAFNEDGSRVVLACESGRLRWWDPLLGEETASHPIGSRPVHAAAFSRGGARVAAVVVGPERKAIGWWETSTGRSFAETREVDKPCHSLAISPDGQWIVGTSMERAAWIWNIPSSRFTPIDGNQMATARYARPIAFYPNAAAVLLGGHLGWLGRFDLNTGKRHEEHELLTMDIHCLRFTGNGSVIAIGEGSNKLYLGSVETGQPIGLLLGHKNRVWGVDFSPDESQIASAGDRTVRLWDLPSGKPAAVLTGHTGEVRSVVFSPDGTRLLSVSQDHTARVWDPRQGDAVSVLNVDHSYARSMALCLGGSRLVTGAWHGYLQQWDAASGESLDSFFAGGPGEEMTRISCVAASRDARHFASSHSEGWLRVWDGWSGALISQAQCHLSRTWAMEIDMSPDGAFLASPYRDGAVGIWSVPALALVSTTPPLGKYVRGIRFSPDGARLAVGVDQTARLLDAGSLKETRAFNGHTGEVSCVAFSQDGSHLASGSLDRTVRIWEAGTGKALCVLSGHGGSISDVVFAPQGLLLASGSEDASIRIWDPVAGHQIAHLRGHSGFVSSLEFSPDGARLFSAAHDGTVRVWDTAPQWTRWQARYRRRRLLEELEPEVSRLFAELQDPVRVMERLQGDPGLSEPRREAAFQSALIKAIEARARR